MQTVDLPVTHVFARRDARKTDDAALRSLIDSIREIGIINPLRVRRARRAVDGIETDAYEVTAGAHRLKAAGRLGIATVPCVIVDDDDLHAELAMIDENLMRAELGAADRASQTARRKAIYEELHPETRQHVAGGNARQGIATDNLSFAGATAAAIGRTERTVRRDAERGDKICAEALALVKGTELDTGTYLDKLKDVDLAQQIETARSALSRIRQRQERGGAKENEPRFPVESEEREEAEQRRALVNAWNKAGPNVRAWFRTSILENGCPGGDR